MLQCPRAKWIKDSALARGSAKGMRLLMAKSVSSLCLPVESSVNCRRIRTTCAAAQKPENHHGKGLIDPYFPDDSLIFPFGQAGFMEILNCIEYSLV